MKDEGALSYIYAKKARRSALFGREWLLDALFVCLFVPRVTRIERSLDQTSGGRIAAVDI